MQVVKSVCDPWPRTQTTFKTKMHETVEHNINIVTNQKAHTQIHIYFTINYCQSTLKAYQQTCAVAIWKHGLWSWQNLASLQTQCHDRWRGYGQCLSPGSSWLSCAPVCNVSSSSSHSFSSSQTYSIFVLLNIVMVMHGIKDRFISRLADSIIHSRSTDSSILSSKPSLL